MKCKWLFTTVLLSLIPLPSWGSENVSPYAGQVQREIKALSEEHIQGYLSGKGMGFAKTSISEEQLQKLVAEISFIRGKLRFVHLSAHLVQREILLPAQIQRYDKLRGYDISGHNDRYHHKNR